MSNSSINSLAQLRDVSPLPKVIFLDAVNTLFGVRGSVGHVYQAIASQFDVELEPNAINRAFYKSFVSAPTLAFPDVPPEQVPQLEFEWWEKLAYETFTEAGFIEQFNDFPVFFKHLYAHFATAAPWYLYPEVLSVLQHWQMNGVELGIISNFDSRLLPVLEQLSLRDFFQTITISSLSGAAKPKLEIFAIALTKHGISPEEAWHIGDSDTEDYQAASKAGIRGFWLQRPD